MKPRPFYKRALVIGVLALLGSARAPASGQTAPAPYPIYRGVDLSYVNEVEDCGGVFRVAGEAVDPFVLFSQQGANLVRVRLWHTPTWTAYSTLPDVKKTLRRARAQGMATLLDFHYSDTWADPEHQTVPAAWADIREVEELGQALYDYTASVLLELDQEGLLPDMVQVGNEINSALVRGENEAGYPIDWPRNAVLLNAGIRAVRAAGPQVMLHIAQPENVEGWLLAAARAGVTDFDIIGISYYPGWSDYSVEATGQLVNSLRYRFGKEVLIAETAYPWTLAGVSESAGNILGRDFLLPGYAATPAGQKDFLIDLMQSVVRNGGLGIVYWEPAWLSTRCFTLWGQGSHWENATFFDFRNGNNLLEGSEFLSYPYELPVEVVFRVTPGEAQPAGGMYFWGDFTGSGRRLVAMQPGAAGAYLLRARLMPGQTVRYGFFAGPNRAQDQEALPAACGGAEGLRTLVVGEAGGTVTHRFGACA
jgi:arabinogalactan endo-1,4-beta-galactosidase